jgi:hypothetical protein
MSSRAKRNPFGAVLHGSETLRGTTADYFCPGCRTRTNRIGFLGMGHGELDLEQPLQRQPNHDHHQQLPGWAERGGGRRGGCAAGGPGRNTRAPTFCETVLCDVEASMSSIVVPVDSPCFEDPCAYQHPTYGNLLDSFRQASCESAQLVGARWVRLASLGKCCVSLRYDGAGDPYWEVTRVRHCGRA